MRLSGVLDFGGSTLEGELVQGLVSYVRDTQ